MFVRRRSIGFLLVAFAIAHVLFLRTGYAAIASNVAIALASTIAAIACGMRAYRAKSDRATTWLLISGGLVVWTVSQVSYLVYENVLKIAVPTPSISDFLFFVSGIPILLALTLVRDEKGKQVLRMLDSIQAALTTLLVGFYTLHLAILTGTQVKALAAHLDAIFYCEALLLASVATLRFVAERRSSLRVDFAVLAIFLWLKLCCEVIGNAAELYWQVPTGTFLDLVWTVPFLLLTFLVFRAELPIAPAKESTRTSLGIILENLGPALLVVPVLIFGVFVARLEPALGVSAIGVSFLVYVCRAGLVQRLLAKSEAARRQSEAQFRRVFNEAPLGIGLVDAGTYSIRAANSALGRILGVPSDDLKGRKITDFIVAEEASSSEIRLGPNETRQLERRYMRPDGEIVWARTTLSQLHNTDGGPDLQLGMVEDISHRKRADRFAQARNQVLEMIVRNEPLVPTLELLVRAVSDGQAGVRCMILLLQEEQLYCLTSSHDDDRISRVLRHLAGKAANWQLIRDAAKNAQFDGCWIAAIRSGTEEVLGAVTLLFDKEYNFSSFDSEMVENASRIIALGIGHERLHKKLIDQIHHDALTGLANRVLLEDRLKHAVHHVKRYGTKLAVLGLDLDRFKLVNDTFGHHTGDLVLEEVARRLAARVRNADTVARISGDEFCIVLSNFGEDAKVERVAQDVLAALRVPMILDGLEIEIGACIGIAQYPEGGEDFEALLRSADQALYRAKHNGRGKIARFSPEFGQAAIMQRHLEANLRHALENDGFELHYQLQYTAKGELSGVEALLRFSEADLRMISPAVFIPVAEESGLIVPIGEWVLRKACQQWVSWCIAGIQPVPIAVNVSAVQFSRADFAKTVALIIEETGMEACNLELELTESVVMRDVEESARQMQHIKNLGVHLAIDDFGTGYSSLSYLYRLPIDTLKVDRSFVQKVTENGGTGPIVGAIASLARMLGLRTVAEGVETEEQLSELQQAGCSHVQGFLFARPMQVDKISALLAGRHDQSAITAARVSKAGV